MTSSTDDAAQRKLPAEFDTLFRAGSYERPPQEVQHRYAKTIESTRILPVKRRLGGAILRRLARIRPSEAVAFAAVFAIGVDAGVMWGVSLQDGVSPNQNRTQIAGPEKPGTPEQESKDPQKDHTKSKDRHNGDTNASDQHEAVKSIDITKSENVAKAIADNKDSATTKDTGAQPEEPEPASSPTETPQETEPEPDPETSEPTPLDTPKPTESSEPSPTPTETAPDPDPISETPSPQSTESEPKATPTAQESAATPTATAQEVTPTLEGAGSGTAAAMPSSIMSTLIAVQE